MHGYSVLGLRVLATRPLPGLVAADAAAPADVVIRLGALPPEAQHGSAADVPVYTSPDRDEAGRPLVIVRALAAGSLFLLHYADGTEFVVDDDGTEVWGRWPAPATFDDAATYLVGPVLAFVLRRRGITCLHASAVALGERAIALVGPAGAGKSTLAAGFAGRGHAALADDVVALRRSEGAFRVGPGSPRIRLWPDSVAALYGSPDALPRLTPTWDKRFLDLTEPAGGLPPHPLPLAAVYLLASAAPAPGLPCVADLSVADGLMALIANTSVNYLLDESMRAQEFETLGDLVGSVPVRRLLRYDDTTLVSRLCELICDDVERPSGRGAHV
jgi:hypothetical protein